MIAYDEALARMLDGVAPLPVERVPIADACGRILAEPVVSELDSPRCDVSSMDGYAVRMSDAQSGSWLKIVGESGPGAPFHKAIQPGEAVRILTGGGLPDGADCVVIQEEIELRDGKIRAHAGFGPARYIRACGSDFRKGETLLARGSKLAPGSIVALAGADQAWATVSRAPLVTIIATGDELVAPGEAARRDFAIPDSASAGVRAMVKGSGAEVVGIERGVDKLPVLQALADRALLRSDLVIVLGGASVGDRDFARPMFDHAELELFFSRVAIKPGKPVWFGKAGGKYVLGLPGNPGSAMVTARLFMVPLLTAMQGGDGQRKVRCCPQLLAEDIPRSGARETFDRARMTPDGLKLVRNQGSGAQSPLASSDWLIRRPPNDPPRHMGETVPAMMF